MFRPDHRTRRPVVLRRLSVVTAVVFGLAQLLVGLHLATVRHARCADHGELVHADGHGGHAHQSGTTLEAPTPDGPADEHDHCTIAVARETPVSLPQIARLPHRPTVVELDPPRLACAPAFATARLYLLAPKTSPPA